MSRFPSPRDAERLLAGDVVNDDLPDEAARLARLLSSMRNPGAAENPVAEQRAISTIAARIRGGASVQPELLRSHRFSRRVSAKAAAIGLAAVLATGTAAAAANGSLPGPVQRAVSDTLSHVSISVPHPDEHANANAGSGGPDIDHGRGPSADAPPAGAQGPDAAGDAKSGLCTAAAQGPPSTSNGKRDDAVAFSNLQKAAADAGMTVTEFCAGVTPHPDSQGSDASTTTTTVTTPTTGPHGPPPSNPGKGGEPTTSTTPAGPTGATGSGVRLNEHAAPSGSAHAESHANAGP